ncbi:hypothetical protein FRB90_010170 [Tulasnella sp. 427]|nr:hypothetical protein FRB90_010170 [Tulasnella sp. 427]
MLLLTPSTIQKLKLLQKTKNPVRTFVFITLPEPADEGLSAGKRARVPTRNNTGDSQHDHATAIQDLPESCIRLIIIYATPNPLLAPGKTYRKRLYDLIRVCVEWKSVIEKTPTLWSHLTSSNPPAMLDACVRRSLGIPVTVRFDGLLHPPITVSAELDRFIDKIAARRGDWKSVQFINLPPTSSSISSINRALAGSKPRLTSSEATTIYKTPVSGLDGRLCFSDAPRLRDITIAGFTLDPSNVTGAFHSLQRLQLHGPMYLTSSFLLFQLSKNKSLRYLELEDIQIISSQSLYHLDTLELPELRQLNLSLLASQTTEVIEVFNRLRAPKLRRMKLSIDMDDLTQLALTSNHLQSCTESFLVQLGNRLSGLMILDDFRTRSAYRWLHPAQANVFDKSILHWVAKGSPDGQYSSALLDTRLHTNSSDTKRLISDWAEDVKTYEEEALVRASLLEGLHDMDRMVSFRAYRIQVLEDRKGN